MKMGKHGFCRKSYCTYRKFGSFLFLVSFLTVGVYLGYTREFTKGEYSTRKSSMFAGFENILTKRKADNKKTAEKLLQEQDYRVRVARYQDVCAVRKENVNSNEKVLFFKNPLTNFSLSYCKVPKTGCTFWKRIYQFLNRSSNGHKKNISNPLDITRFEAQHSAIVKLRGTRHNVDKMADALRFFFVRDPYARLKSAYVDKFLLPQFLTWGLFGKTIADKKKLNLTTSKHKCIKELVTFNEFIDIIVLSGNRDYHWRPINSVCDPCKLFPQIIGKQETFARDAKYILKKVGLEHLMTEYSHKTYVEDEIEQVVDFTFSSNYVRYCFNKTEAASRLWRAFQINGYLPSSMMFPKRQMDRLLQNVTRLVTAKNIVTKFIIKENIRAHMSRDQHSKQKRDMMINEFSSLSEVTMERLADMYETDFNMFGYDKYPKDLFPWRYLME